MLLLPDTPAPDLRSAIHQLYVRADPRPLAALLEIREKIETKFKVEKERVNIEIFPGELKSNDKEEEKKQTTKYNIVQGRSDYNKSSEATTRAYKEPKVDSERVVAKSTCDVCKLYFENEDLLSIHKIKDHFGLSSKSKYLQNVFNERVVNTGEPDLLTNHKPSNDEKNIITSTDSSVKFQKTNQVMSEEPTNEKLLVGCASVSSTFSTSVKENFTEYITCEQCGRTDVRKAGFREHNRRHHSGIRFPCPVCSIAVKDKPQLTKHMRLHDPNRPPPKIYTCESCGKSGMTHRMYKGHTRRNHTHQYRVELETKVALIKAREQPNATTAGVAKHFNLGLSTVQQILRHKEKHLRNYIESASS